MPLEKYKRHSELAKELHKSFTPKRGIGFYVKRLIPRTEWGIYFTPEGRRLVIWRSWLWKSKVVLYTKLKL